MKLLSSSGVCVLSSPFSRLSLSRGNGVLISIGFLLPDVTGTLRVPFFRSAGEGLCSAPPFPPKISFSFPFARKESRSLKCPYALCFCLNPPRSWGEFFSLHRLPALILLFSLLKFPPPPFFSHVFDCRVHSPRITSYFAKGKEGVFPCPMKKSSHYPEILLLVTHFPFSSLGESFQIKFSLLPIEK